VSGVPTTEIRGPRFRNENAGHHTCWAMAGMVYCM